MGRDSKYPDGLNPAEFCKLQRMVDDRNERLICPFRSLLDLMQPQAGRMMISAIVQLMPSSIRGSALPPSIIALP